MAWLSYTLQKFISLWKIITSRECDLYGLRGTVGRIDKDYYTTLYTVDATEYVTAQIDAIFHEVSEECKTVS